MIDVLADGRSLYDAGAYRGMGTYLRNVLSGLGALPDLGVRALVPRGTPMPSGVMAEPIRRVAPGRWARQEHELLLPRDIRRAGCEVYFSPGLEPPRRVPVPWLQTLHDVIPLEVEYSNMRGPREHLLRMAPRFRRASAVVAVSDYNRRRGIALLDLDPSRVHVVHLAADPVFTPPDELRQDGRRDVLMVKEYDERKGYAEAMAAVARLADMGYPHRLRIAGRLVPWTRPTVERLVAASPRPDRVDLLDFVPPPNLVGEYHRACVAVVTSRYEGFGLPALEAMACGTPVVAFDNTATAEVVAGGGVLVPDGDVAAFTDAVAALLEDETAWREQAKRGLTRARSFSWDRTVAGHALLIRSISARI